MGSFCASRYDFSPLPDRQTFLQIGQHGGTETVGTTSLPKTLNAYLAAETSSTDVIGQMYLGLVTTNAVTTAIEPSLAKSWSVSPDKRTYTFRLQQDLKWSDGHPLTADDVVFTYNEIIDNPHIPNNYRDGMLVNGQFPKVKKIDEFTVQFILPTPYVPFLRGLSDPIMPHHVFQGTTTPDENENVVFHTMWGVNMDLDDLVVNGPWILKALNPGQDLILERNPHYYLTDAQGQKLPYLDALKFKLYDSLDAIKTAFEQGEIDLISLRAEDALALFKNPPPQTKIYNLGPATGTLFVMFNQSSATDDSGQPLVSPQKQKWFRNPQFKQALAHAVNKPKMNEMIYHGLATPQWSHISQQNPFYNPNTPTYPYDLNRAADLLKSAGFVKKQGQLFDKEGYPVRFQLVTNLGNAQREDICKLMQKDWQSLGIDVKFNAISFNDMVNQIDQSLDWEAMVIGLTGSAIEPHFGINTWLLDGRMHMFNMGHPKRWTGQSPTDYMDWEKEMSRLYKQAAETFEPDERKALYHQSQVLAATQLPFIYLMNQSSLIAVKQNLGNVMPRIHGGSGNNQVLWNSDYHYLKGNGGR